MLRDSDISIFGSAEEHVVVDQETDRFSVHADGRHRLELSLLPNPIRLGRKLNSSIRSAPCLLLVDPGDRLRSPDTCRVRPVFELLHRTFSGMRFFNSTDSEPRARLACWTLPCRT